MREMPDLAAAMEAGRDRDGWSLRRSRVHLEATSSTQMPARSGGRCTSVCPANATGKPLDPREIVLKLGEVAAASGDPVVAGPVGVDLGITISSDSVFERITSRRAVGVHHMQGV